MYNRKLLIASTSTVHGSGYLEYLAETITGFFGAFGKVLFIPYARPGGAGYDEYTETARSFFESQGMAIKGIHQYETPMDGILEADGFFVGGGNTFVLLKTLYDNNLMPILRERIRQGVPYMGTSAGSNILGPTIQTTNDMPIVFPPSFDALGIVPFNINPHYIDPDPDSTHMGETRETRIREFHAFNYTTVCGLREGSYLMVNDDEIELGGHLPVRVFSANNEPQEMRPGSDLSFLLR